MGCGMRKVYTSLNKNKIGSIGIGAMIVFISMVLVAGIAASVLISTSTNLEMQALKTGQENIAEVASAIRVESIEGYNSSGKITKMAVEVATRAGSPDVDLGEVVVEISDSSNKYILRYGGDLCAYADINGDLFSVGNFGDADDFDLIVVQDADISCSATNAIINFGDHVMLALDTSSVFSPGISPMTDVYGMIIPEVGAPAIIGFTSPSSYADQVMELQ